MGVLVLFENPHSLTVPSQLNHRLVREDVLVERLQGRQLLLGVVQTEETVLLGDLEAVPHRPLHETRVLPNPRQNVPIAVKFADVPEGNADLLVRRRWAFLVEREEDLLELEYGSLSPCFDYFLAIHIILQ